LQIRKEGACSIALSNIQESFTDHISADFWEIKIFSPDTSELGLIQGFSDLVRKSGALILK